MKCKLHKTCLCSSTVHIPKFLWHQMYSTVYSVFIFNCISVSINHLQYMGVLLIYLGTAHYSV